MTKSPLKAAEVSALLRARNSLLWVVTTDVAWTEKYLIEAAASAGYLAHTWDIVQGFCAIDERVETDEGQGNADAALDYIKGQKGTPDRPNRNVFIMRNLGPYITPPLGPITLQRLENLARWLPKQPVYSAQAVVVVSPSSEVPPELSGTAKVIEWPMPDREEIAALLDSTVESLPKALQKTAVNGQRDAAIDAAVGLSAEEAQSTFASSLVQFKRIDPTVIAQEKKRVIAKDGLLEWFDPIPGGFDAVGGLDAYKSWLMSRAIAYSPEARAYGLQPPKGTLVIGVSGCGKSLSVKATGTGWRVPVIKLDLGALRSKYVGESESNLRNAFRKIEAAGRVIVWVDEIEKALAGATGESGDGGVSADALGAILTWMQDRQGEAFVMATANDASKLPPELLRKGRFDEVWWVDLPNRTERVAIVAAALRANGRDADQIGIDLEAVADATDTFTGAEIAALVPDAMFTAFADDAREITTDDLLNAAKVVVPLAETAKEKIATLRETWKGRARAATSPVAITKAAAPRGSQRVLDI